MLSLILDFVDQGSIDVPKFRMNEFLTGAPDLQSQGLLSENQSKDQITSDIQWHAVLQNQTKASQRHPSNVPRESKKNLIKK